MATDRVFEEIARRLKDGLIVPFFGAGASLSCGMPSARVLAQRLMDAGEYPKGDQPPDLALAASYLVQKEDDLVLNREVRSALSRELAKPGRLHQLLARSDLSKLRLYVTTNYDRLVEDALATREPWIVVDRGERGVVHCRSLQGGWEDVTPDEGLRRTIADSTHPVVLKMHGSLDAHDESNDYFLITEEHYVDFLGRPREALIPAMLYSHMKARSLLFLGYGLRDWNVRVLLRHLAESRGASSNRRSWAVVLHPSPAETMLWESRGVTMIDMDLDAFALRIEESL